MDDKLCDRLEELSRQIHTELASVDNLDERKREMLQRLQVDIAAALERCDEEEEPNLFERLDEVVGEFEVSHPSLTATIGHVMDILSNSGI